MEMFIFLKYNKFIKYLLTNKIFMLQSKYGICRYFNNGYG